ncbi:DUF3013 family protein [Ligilactobacillus salivarius]|jgi:hypothetical protein|uniref:DUF3013 family protein n=1 Tax=Ligilactobacillus salivarius TaxID=1624 RepID=UPI0002EAF097|nr:DUF3013 family protein [Ligilactobacillus salivarius]
MGEEKLVEAADLNSFLKETVKTLDFDGDIFVNWNKKDRQFEMELTFYAENKEATLLTDTLGVESTEPVVTFIDEILIYDKNREKNFDEDDYLVCLPYDGKNGWYLAEAKAFVSYLQIVLDNGESDLLDFLTDDEKEIFELVWSEDEYKKIIESNMLSLPNPNNRIKYPKF